MKDNEQLSFSSLIFDTLFGIAIFFSIDSFMEIKGIPQLLFYAFSIIVIVHWWLNFKSADDMFTTEVSNSVTDIALGIVEVILLQYFIINAKDFSYMTSTILISIVILLDLAWGLIWRYIGKWKTNNISKIDKMNKELETTIKLDFCILIAFILILAISSIISEIWFLALFFLTYIIYIIFSFKLKIIDLEVF